MPFDMAGVLTSGADGYDSSPSPLELPTIGHIGRYVLKYRVGQGGLGTVFAAHDPLLSRLIAIKTVSPRIAGEERESFNEHFLNEARAAAGLSHPNIVTVFDAGVSAQGAYIAMELLKGRDLRQLRHEGWKPTPAEAALIVRRVAEALAYAHSKGVIHCDVKPANIFMAAPGHPKVLDFGIARILRPTETSLGKHIGGGSPRYMAPEQLRGEQTDRRIDVFSLGVVLYELLTDVCPFARPSLDGIKQAVCEFEPSPAHLAAPGVPVALSLIVAHAMRKDPSHRYQSAKVFADELQRWLGEQPGESVTPKPVPGRVSRAAASKSSTGKRRRSAPASTSTSTPSAEAVPPLVRGGMRRGWSVTGLASIAVLAGAAAVWLGDAGIGLRPGAPATQEIGPVAAASDTTTATSSAQPTGLTSASASEFQPARSSTAAPPRAVIASSDAALPGLAPSGAAAVREMPPGFDQRANAGAPPVTESQTSSQTAGQAPLQPSGRLEAPGAAAPLAVPLPLPLPESGPGSEEILTDPALPTVRMSPRVRPAGSGSVQRVKRTEPSQSARAGGSSELFADPARLRGEVRLAPISTAVPRRVGYVELRVTPSAEIDIDGARWGSAADLVKLRMTEGPHVITLNREGFAPHRLRVVVAEGRPVLASHHFRP